MTVDNGNFIYFSFDGIFFVGLEFFFVGDIRVLYLKPPFNHNTDSSNHNLKKLCQLTVRRNYFEKPKIAGRFWQPVIKIIMRAESIASLRHDPSTVDGPLIASLGLRYPFAEVFRFCFLNERGLFRSSYHSSYRAAKARGFWLPKNK